MLFQGVSNDAERVPALLEQGEAGGLHSVQRERMQVKWVKEALSYTLLLSLSFR